MTDALMAADTTTADQAATETPVATTEQPAAAETTVEPQSTEAEATEAEAKPEATEKPAPKAPEKYDEFTTPEGMPEGFERDKVVFEAFEAVARDLDLSQESAQQLVDKVLPTMHQRALEMQKAQHEQWVQATRNDTEIGGDKLDENLAAAKRAVKAYASDGLQELLNGPLGSHPEVVRFLVKVGKTVSEDQFVGGGAGGQVDRNDESAMAKRLYPTSQR